MRVVSRLRRCARAPILVSLFAAGLVYVFFVWTGRRGDAGTYRAIQKNRGVTSPGNARRTMNGDEFKGSIVEGRVEGNRTAEGVMTVRPSSESPFFFKKGDQG